MAAAERLHISVEAHRQGNNQSLCKFGRPAECTGRLYVELSRHLNTPSGYWLLNSNHSVVLRQISSGKRGKGLAGVQRSRTSAHHPLQIWKSVREGSWIQRLAELKTFCWFIWETVSFWVMGRREDRVYIYI